MTKKIMESMGLIPKALKARLMMQEAKMLALIVVISGIIETLDAKQRDALTSQFRRLLGKPLHAAPPWLDEDEKNSCNDTFASTLMLFLPTMESLEVSVAPERLAEMMARAARLGSEPPTD
jgi:hypothetical protein